VSAHRGRQPYQFCHLSRKFPTRNTGLRPAFADRVGGNYVAFPRPIVDCARPSQPARLYPLPAQIVLTYHSEAHADQGAETSAWISNDRPPKDPGDHCCPQARIPPPKPKLASWTESVGSKGHIRAFGGKISFPKCTRLTSYSTQTRNSPDFGSLLYLTHLFLITYEYLLLKSDRTLHLERPTDGKRRTRFWV